MVAFLVLMFSCFLLFAHVRSLCFGQGVWVTFFLDYFCRTSKKRSKEHENEGAAERIYKGPLGPLRSGITCGPPGGWGGAALYVLPSPMQRCLICRFPSSFLPLHIWFWFPSCV